MRNIIEIFREDRVVLFLTAIFTFLLPLSTKFSNYILLALLGVMTLYFLSHRADGMVNRKIRWVIVFQTTIVIVILLLSGLFYTKNMEGALGLLKHYIYYLLVPIVFSFLSSTLLTKVRSIGSYYYVVGCLVSAIILLVNNFIEFSQYVYWNTFDLKKLFSYEFTYHKFASLLSFHPTMLGLYFSLAIVFLNENRILSNNKVKNFFILTLLICVLFLNSRTSFLFLFIYSLYYVARLLKRGSINKRLLFRYLFIAFIVGGVCLSLFRNTFVYKRLVEQVKWELTENKGTTYDGVYSNDSRMSRWRAIVDKSKESPIIGFGTAMQGTEVLKAYEEHGLEYALKYKYDPHNYYLFVLVEHGVLGLLIFTCFLFYQLSLFREKDTVAFLFILFIIIGCFFDSILYLTPCILLFSFFSNLFFFKNKDWVLIKKK